MMLAKSGHDVGVVEKYRDVGGGCTHWATIPSKALRHTVQRMADLRADPLFHRAIGAVELSYPDLLERAGRVIASQSKAQPGAANTLRYFTETTFNYPTMAEAYRVAALNGLNRIF